VILSVRVIPRSPRSRIDGRRGDAILVRLAAPPVDGAANDALIDLLARAFDRPRRDITILSGLASRDKRVEIRGIGDDDGARILSGILNREPR
jgi:uncharacterized protein (TIGR00251 family)